MFMIEPVVFKMPPFEEFFDKELLFTAYEFHKAGLLISPFPKIEVLMKYTAPWDNDDISVDMMLSIEQDDLEPPKEGLLSIGVFVKNKADEYKSIGVFAELRTDGFVRLGGNIEKIDDHVAIKRWMSEVALMSLIVINLPQYDHNKVVISEKLQRAREKRGKPRLRDYIQLSLKKEYTDARKASGGRSGVAPHWRRGHLRRLPTGKVTSVQPCIVGFNGQAVKPKEYRVGGKNV